VNGLYLEGGDDDDDDIVIQKSRNTGVTLTFPLLLKRPTTPV
jgi:hypothetical protein